MPEQTPYSWESAVQGAIEQLADALKQYEPEPTTEEIGHVVRVSNGIAVAAGLRRVQLDEHVLVEGRRPGIVFGLGPEEVELVLFDAPDLTGAGAEVKRTSETFQVPVGEALIGRVVDSLGRPLDDGGPVRSRERRPAERPAPPIMHRAPVTVPLQTGVKVVDTLIPIGRGQRELILGDRQTGKSALAVDTVINQAGKDVVCIYCAIGQRASAVAKVIASLRDSGAMDYTIVVVAHGDDTPGLQFMAPYAATSMGEYFMEQGADVLIIYDDLTKHAIAYRELSLLMRRPPGREAFPGDIFYIHSRLLERSTHLRDEHGGGSLTALPIVETQAQQLSAYIPTNLISITDGQVYFSPNLFRKGILPAVDVGKSVSRVGGKTQLRAYRDVSSDLRLSYSQFEELEGFARFGTRIDEETRRTIEHGERVREILKQKQNEPIPVEEQIPVLLAVKEGKLDEVPLNKVRDAEEAIRKAVRQQAGEISDLIRSGKPFSDENREAIIRLIEKAIEPFAEREDLSA